MQFAYFVQRDQHGIIAKYLTQSSILMSRFRCSSRRGSLNSLLLNMGARTVSPAQVHGNCKLGDLEPALWRA